MLRLSRGLKRITGKQQAAFDLIRIRTIKKYNLVTETSFLSFALVPRIKAVILGTTYIIFI